MKVEGVVGRHHGRNPFSVQILYWFEPLAQGSFPNAICQFRCFSLSLKGYGVNLRVGKGESGHNLPFPPA